ncbi:MAG: CocE/NonD family hydrolase [Ignavibacteria bacterium]|nr:MAG: CocE/NonD family hydrolase [Ignavibacteria bacterium]
MKKLSIVIFFFLISVVYAQQYEIKDHYTKKEYRIPMRDGVKLFVSVYMPKDNSEKHPILLWRTPYSCSPYGEDKFSRRLLRYKHFLDENYIIVFQDVRGKFMSEGKFVDMRPYKPNKKDKETDEASDAYDTVDWLIKNIPNNNGNVGIWGISYPGFYAAMAAMSGHPAIKAVSPQAPISDWFIDDDMHHNGAFTLMMAFNFFKVFGQPRDSLTTHWTPGPEYDSPDAYSFFLNVGPLKYFNEKILHGKIEFWNQAMANGIYNDFWKSRSTLNHFESVNTSVATVGGWFDNEDLFGALHTYSTIEKKNEGIFNVLIMGPWTHGAWSRGEVTSYGIMNFGENTSEYYRQKVELPFFNHFLKGKGEINLPEALIFETGNNKWHQFDAWPPKNLTNKELYFSSNGNMTFDVSTVEEGFEEYLSDPNKPVPYTAQIHDSRNFYNRNYMVEDQRFAAYRPDVLVYATDELKEDVTVAGPIDVELFVSTTSTDADFVVKLIDVFPDSASNPKPNPNNVEMGGYQMMIRGDIFRGKFRNGFDNPQPFEPNKIEKVKFQLQDILHTFKKGHKIMVQVQSSWFPLFDRNPQTFCDIYNADYKDFVKAFHKVYHKENNYSKISFGVLK